MKKERIRGWVYIIFMALIGIAGGVMIHLSIVDAHTKARQISDETVHRIAATIPNDTTNRNEAVRAALAYWHERTVSEPVNDILWRDLGIAIVIAAILALSIETYARLRFQDELRSGIVEAAFQRVIPQSVFEQVKTHLLRARLLKTNWSIEMNVHRDDHLSQNNSGLYVSSTILRYRLSSLTEKREKVTLSMALDKDVTAKDASNKMLPRFRCVTVDGKRYQEAALGNNPMEFKPIVRVGSTPVEVTVEIDEIIRVPDTFVWNTAYCTERCEVRINVAPGLNIGFEIIPLHPQPKRLFARGHKNMWDFESTFLPWQGLQFRTYELATGASSPPQPHQRASAATGSDGNSQAVPQSGTGTTAAI